MGPNKVKQALVVFDAILWNTLQPNLRGPISLPLLEKEENSSFQEEFQFKVSQLIYVSYALSSLNIVLVAFQILCDKYVKRLEMDLFNTV